MRSDATAPPAIATSRQRRRAAGVIAQYIQDLTHAASALPDH